VPVAEGELGAQLAEPVGVLVQHLAEVVREHADEILSREATKHLVDELKKTSPAVVEELIPAQMKLADVQQILQLLLREGVSIRPLAQILEALGEHAARTADPRLLAELVRRRLARTISARCRDKHNRLHVVMLDAAVEEAIAETIDGTGQARLAPRWIEGLCRRIAEESALAEGGRVLLVSPRIRSAVKQIVAAHHPRLTVLSHDEVTRDTEVELAATISAETLGAGRPAVEDLRSVAA
jgi:flagellar biosynthesis protein FlhA